jgi:hypothetical protein
MAPIRRQAAADSPWAWIVAAVVGLGLLYYFSRRRRVAGGPQGAPGQGTAQGSGSSTVSTSESLVDQMRAKRHYAWKVAICTESFLDNTEACNLLETLAKQPRCDLFVFHLLRAGETEAEATNAILSKVPSLRRIRILKCSTAKGYEAFARQLTPTLFVTKDPVLAKFLAQFLAFVVVVSDDGQSATDRPNMIRVTSLTQLPI